MKKIVSLKYGRITAKNIFISFAVFLLGCGLIACAFLFWENNFEGILVSILGLPGGLFLAVSGAYFTIKYIYAKIQMKKWRKNAITLKAYAKGIANPVISEDYRPSMLRLTFLYEGTWIEKYTEARDIAFAQFCDSEIDILYASKYNQVLIIKQE